MNSTPFYLALTQLALADQPLLESRLDAWAASSRLGRVIVPNLRQLERLLPVPNMLEIIQVLLKNRGTSDGELANAYGLECRRHVLLGGPVDSSCAPALLGRAIDREEFIGRLHDMYGAHKGGPFANRDVAADFVGRLELGDALSTAEKALLMSQFASWVTWSEAGGTPFDFAFTHRAAHVLACLGLAPINRDPHRPLLLLTYSASSVGVLYKPTVADAATYEYFQPPLPGAAHGRTRPWPAAVASTILGTDFDPVPRPEALHKPAAFEALLGSIKVFH